MAGHDYQLRTSRVGSLVFLSLILVTAGCGSPATVDALVEALGKAGLSVSELGPSSISDIPGVRIDEGVSLQGDDLRVEILRIEDRRSYDAVVTAGALIALAGAWSEQTHGTPDIHYHQPFVVIVYDEPEPGMIGSELRRILN